MKFFSKSDSDSRMRGAESNTDSPAKDSNADSNAKESTALSLTNDANSNNTHRKISNYAIICIAFLICVFNPYALYNTDITQFDSTQTIATLSALFGAFLATSFIAIYLTSFIPKRFSKIPAFILSLTLFVGLIYSLILVGDYGVMDRFYFDKNPFVYDSIEPLIRQSQIFVAVITAGVLVIAVLFRWLIVAMRVILPTLFIVSCVDAYHIIAQRNNAKEMADGLFSYSKTQKNIVVIMLDMFNGTHTPYLLEQFPHLRKQLDGFTHFPNAVSSANLTMPTIATLIGGEHYTALNMNKRAQNLTKGIDSAFVDTANAFARGGFSVNIMSPVGTNAQIVQGQMLDGAKITDYATQQFVDFYAKDYGFFDKLIPMREFVFRFDALQLLLYGVFKFAPEFYARPSIYNNGYWHFPRTKRAKSYAPTAINYASTFYTFTRKIDAQSTKPTFKFLYSPMTHGPFSAYFDGDKCDFFTQKTAWDDYPHKKISQNPLYSVYKSYYQHYDAEACALRYLADYVELLKGAGIYDNTQIFVVSDHGGNDNINLPLPNDNDKNNLRPDVILLFKDFGAKGAIRTDKRLMANYDIVSIFCENLQNGCPNVGRNILQNYPKNREIIHSAVYYWIVYKNKPSEWVISKAYRVSGGDIYDAKNWREVK